MDATISLPSGKFGTILADPAWKFALRSAKGEGRSADRHYQCMSLADIKALPVGDIAEKDSVLLMWVTDPFLELSFEVLKSWGFRYKTVGFYWVKTGKSGKPCIGQGYWTRANPEQCLLATRGNPKRIAKNVERLIVAPRREHSRKPDEQYDRIQRLVGGPYCELFARQRWPGWETWGNQTDKFEPGPQ